MSKVTLDCYSRSCKGAFDQILLFSAFTIYASYFRLKMLMRFYNNCQKIPEKMEPRLSGETPPVIVIKIKSAQLPVLILLDVSIIAILWKCTQSLKMSDVKVRHQRRRYDVILLFAKDFDSQKF